MPIQFNGTGTISGVTAAIGQGATTNAPAASVITLTNTSSQYQVVQQTTGATSLVNLPDATTLQKGSAIFIIENKTQVLNGTVVVRNSAGAPISSVTHNLATAFSLIDNSTAAGVWRAETVTIQSPAIVDSASLTAYSVTSLGNTSYTRIVRLSATTFVTCCFTKNSTASTSVSVICRYGSISGSTITLTGNQTFTLTLPNALTDFINGNPDYQQINLRALSSTSFVLLAGVFGYTSGGDAAGFRRLMAFTISGTTISMGTAVAIGPGGGVLLLGQAASYAANGSMDVIDSTRVFMTYNSATDSNGAWNGSLTGVVASISGTTITLGTTVALGTSTNTQPWMTAVVGTNKALVVYTQAAAPTNSTAPLRAVTASFSGTVITWNTPVSSPVQTAVDNPYGWSAAVDSPRYRNQSIVSPSTDVAVLSSPLTSLIMVSGTVPAWTFEGGTTLVGSLSTLGSTTVLLGSQGFLPTSSVTANNGQTYAITSTTVYDSTSIYSLVGTAAGTAYTGLYAAPLSATSAIYYVRDTVSGSFGLALATI
jgi:hypothetical protein